jgi:hypothetical protein
MEQQRRSIVTVIDQMLEVIPKEEVLLITALTKYKTEQWNQSPEALTFSYNWVPVQRILGAHIQEINSPWKETVRKIFTNEI